MDPRTLARLEGLEADLARALPSPSDPAWIEAIAGGTRHPIPPAAVDRINAPAQELLRRGGKRWRPLVLVLVHEMCGGQDPRAGRLSPMVELPHNGSLIIDDIEDRAEERRGGPAVHLIHGLDLSINAGNFLYFSPTYLLDALSLDEGLQFKMLRYYLRTMRRLHFGQGLDIQWHNDHAFVPPRDEYLQMCRFKTGALSGLAAELGAVLAGAEPDRVAALGEIWEDIGVGFQILDDVRNLTTGNPGKRRGDDLIEGKKSLPVLLYCEGGAEARRRLLERLEVITAAGNQVDQALIEEAIGWMEEARVLDEAARQAGELLSAGLERLAGLVPSSSARDEAEALVKGFQAQLRG